MVSLTQNITSQMFQIAPTKKNRNGTAVILTFCLSQCHTLQQNPSDLRDFWCLLTTAINFQLLYTHTSVLTSRTCLNSVDMDASFDCKPTTTLDECDKRWRPFWWDCLWFRATSWSFAICWFRLFRSSFIMYVSSCISVGRSLKSDFLFATEIKMLYLYHLRR